jgi:hypothetical protein
VISFDAVIVVSLNVMPRRWDQLIEHPRIDRCGVGHDLGLYHFQGGDRSAEEPAGSIRVAAG